MKVIIIIIIVTTLILLFVDESIVKFVSVNFNSIIKVDYILFSNSYSHYSNHKSLIFDHCELQELDPWDPTIKKYLNPGRKPWDSCKPDINIITRLIDGHLFIYENTTNGTCNYRCLFSKYDSLLTFDGWSPLVNGSRPKCDIIEVNCINPHERGKIIGTPYYNYLHAQIFRKEELEHIEFAPEKPDVHIILFDSVSHSQFIRSMPKTKNILLNHYETIQFKHLNKIGMNSQPNGYALLIGGCLLLIFISLTNFRKSHRSHCEITHVNGTYSGLPK